MANRLAGSLSPYLLQHAHNPVDWFPWGEEALAKARAEDKPLFLSIGYSACHWCHVMERESFENEAVARLLNERFVPVKVDREERPDLDDLYMDAVQTLTGHGGWPMSVWLAPDLRPFYGGTYFPPEPRRGMPGFIPLLERIAELWTTRRADVLEQAGELTAELQRQARVAAGSELPGEEVFEAALQQLRQAFDPRWGGFSPAPKFPAHMACELILRRGSEADRAMALRSLDAMRDGGMHDHVGGGFARYSVDGRWLVPHFEKMLYDNAQLACAYLLAFQATGDASYADVVRGTLDYLHERMVDPAGGVHSSEDADSEGEEGKFYVFTPANAREALGEADGHRFCEAFGVTAEGNFEHGTSVVHRFSRPAEARMDAAEERALLRRVKAWRDRRIRPAKDDKVLAAWNGLALSAFARGAQVLGRAVDLEASRRLGSFVLDELWKGGTLLRVWRAGKAHTPGFLEDYAAVANGLVDLYEADFEPRWLRFSERLAETMRGRFEDPAEGGFFSTEAGQGDLLFRQKPVQDNAMPSGNSLAVLALLRLARHLDREDFRTSAERALRCAGRLLGRAPRAFLALASALDFALAPDLDIVLAGDPSADEDCRGMLREIHRRFLPNRVLSCGQDVDLPLHEGRGKVDGKATAYVCRNRACDLPATSRDALVARLSVI
ncbi:MAG: thioredoxin domain-containing protein [Holophagaceae bacterium]